jgi:lysophospholipase L1-like esterase
VLGRAGVSHALVLAGVNDFGVQHRNGEDSEAARAQLLVDLQEAWRVLVERAHAQGICVIGATITPYAGNDYYHIAPANEADRQALNRWIRTSGSFDAVADFDAALRDPARPDHLAAFADIGDGLHLSPDGQKRLADAVPLEALQACKWKR